MAEVTEAPNLTRKRSAWPTDAGSQALPFESRGAGLRNSSDSLTAAGLHRFWRQLVLRIVLYMLRAEIMLEGAVSILL